jgi:hypothetical protein
VTQDDALRLADELVGQALKETEARCGVLAQFIGDCDRAGSHTAAWSDALRELHSLHIRRSGLMHRRDLIREALDCPVGESPLIVTHRQLEKIRHQPVGRPTAQTTMSV